MIYFGLMITALVISLVIIIRGIIKHQDIAIISATSIGVSFLLLLLSSIWWFFTEIDGFSQGFGVIYNAIVFILVVVMTLAVTSIWHVWRRRKNE